jgi:hypothetical protein
MKLLKYKLQIAEAFVFFGTVLLALVAFGVINPYPNKAVTDYKLDDESIYTGDLLQGEFSGKGKLTLSDGTVCECTFLNGRILGEVNIYNDGTGNTFPEVQNEESVESESARAQLDDIPKNVWSFTGTILENTDQNIEAIGTLQFDNLYSENITIKNGQIVSDLKILDDKNPEFLKTIKNGSSGVLEITFANGSKYIGHIVNGLAFGEGEFTDIKGWNYKGNFKDGLFSGPGILTFENGEIINGNFENGYPL